MSLIEGQTFAGYEIIAKLGQGGMGSVYQARQTVLQRLVALKTLAPQLAEDRDFIGRFQSEAIAAANLNHPNIVPVYTAGESGGIHYIAMEFVEGQSLRARLDERGRLPPEEALDICYYVALALDHAWNKAKLIHRDIKPDNIFMALNGTVKLGDFGLSKSLSAGATNNTMTGTAMGSPHYISPEQVRGRRDIDFRADIYGLGCTLFHMICGRRVYEDDAALTVFLKHVTDPPPPVLDIFPECPPAIVALLGKMLAKPPEQRHQSYDELIAEILRARQEIESGVEAAPAEVAAPPRSRSSFAYLFLVLVVMAGAAGVLYFAVPPETWKQWKQYLPVSKPPAVLSEPAELRAFMGMVESLPPEQRIEHVMEKLRELNPAFTGKERYVVEDNHVTELSFPSVNVTNLWPIRALLHLQKLDISGDEPGRVQSALADLSGLRGMSLVELDCSWSQVEDLEPLRDMRLKKLRCAMTRVRDLAPLSAMHLNELNCASTAVHDLSPLKGMPLVALRCESAKVTNLAPLKGTPLKNLWCDYKPVRDRDTLLTLTDLEKGNDQVLMELRRLRPRDGLPPGRNFQQPPPP